MRRSPAGRPGDRAPLPDYQPLVVTINGNRLNIRASVDLNGLNDLQDILKRYEGILEMIEKMNSSKQEAATEAASQQSYKPLAQTTRAPA